MGFEEVFGENDGIRDALEVGEADGFGELLTVGEGDRLGEVLVVGEVFGDGLKVGVIEGKGD